MSASLWEPLRSWGAVLRRSVSPLLIAEVGT